jgi:hypothetical protein
MKQGTAPNQSFCPRAEIAAYIDGELSPQEELDLEMHFAACPTCAGELNKQKKLLCVLDFALDGKEEIELPENFTKVVVANAESKVNGLRCPRERNRALWVSVALFLLVILGLGAETSKTVETLGHLGEQFFIVGGFFVHLIHDVTVATTVILRSLCFQFVFKSAVTAILLGIFFLLSLLALSRLIRRHNRF